METSCDDKVLPYLTKMKSPFLCVQIARQIFNRLPQAPVLGANDASWRLSGREDL
jgi:hypothetical protein